MQKLFQPLSLNRGPRLKNRFMLAPLTNMQSHGDGRLSDDEVRWLTQRASGGFGLVMTAAAYVQRVGQGFSGQLGASGDEHIEGLARLASEIRSLGSLSALQIHHAGARSPKELVGTPCCQSDDPETGARALTLGEIEQLRDDYIAAAKRAQVAGFDGIEIHGAHGYLLTRFLSPEFNRREDRYGGSLENRSRILFEIVDGIRAECRQDFQIGLRLSPERFGQRMPEVVDVAAELMRQATIDYLDLSIFDFTKEPEDEAFRGKTLLSYYTELPRGGVRLGAAGKVMSGSGARAMVEAGCDFVMVGRAAILRHDFPERVRRDPSYDSPPLPVTAEHLRLEGLAEPFIEYMRNWPGFVAAAREQA